MDSIVYLGADNNREFVRSPSSVCFVVDVGQWSGIFRPRRPPSEILLSQRLLQVYHRFVG